MLDINVVKCSGCTACKSACSNNSIKMMVNCEGFAFPIVDSAKCIRCGICKSVCPIDSVQFIEKKTELYTAYNLDNCVRKESSSGGIFYLLAKMVIEAGGSVYGAAFDVDFSVKHIRCDDLKSLRSIIGSKYVQSVLGDSFIKVKRELNDGRKVLFSGLPCQVQGLLNFLKKPYENLITIDLACHGVPSPKAWMSYLDYQKKTYQSNIKSISFRNKETGWRNYSVRIEFEDGQVYSKPFGEDIYMLSFLLNYNLRESCGRCQYRTIHRNSDITLADFWDADKLLPEMDDDGGLSIIIVHSTKGDKLFEDIHDRVRFQKLGNDAKECIEKSFNTKVILSPQRDVFFKVLSENGMYMAVKKSSSLSIWKRLFSYCKKCF